MNNKELEKLVQAGCIAGYHYSIIENVPNSGSRESDRLTIVFLNGLSLTVDTFCSGSAENTSLLFKVEPII